MQDSGSGYEPSPGQDTDREMMMDEQESQVESVIDLTILVPQPDPLRDQKEEDPAGVDENTRRGRSLKR